MATSTTTVSGTQTIPEVLEPYFTGDGQAYGLLPKAQELFSRDYASAYGNALSNQGLEGAGRIAGISPAELQAGQQIAGMGQPQQFQTGYVRHRKCLDGLPPCFG